MKFVKLLHTFSRTMLATSARRGRRDLLTFSPSTQRIRNNAIGKRPQVVVHGVLPSPQPSQSAEFGSVLAIQLSDRRLHADEPERVGEQRLDTEQHLRYGQRQTPVVVDRVEPHVAVSTDVRMKDFRHKANDRRLHWIATTKRAQFIYRWVLPAGNQSPGIHCRQSDINQFLLLRL